MVSDSSIVDWTIPLMLSLSKHICNTKPRDTFIKLYNIRMLIYSIMQ